MLLLHCANVTSFNASSIYLQEKLWSVRNTRHHANDAHCGIPTGKIKVSGGILNILHKCHDAQWGIPLEIPLSIGNTRHHAHDAHRGIPAGKTVDSDEYLFRLIPVEKYLLGVSVGNFSTVTCYYLCYYFIAQMLLLSMLLQYTCRKNCGQ